jgi:hypothetical protein
LLADAPGADTGAGREAVVPPDAGPPRWLPRSKRVDLAEEAYYGLRREGDGFVYRADQFEAHVARDGIVTFKDKHITGLDIWPFTSFGKSLPRPKGPTLESTLRDYFSKRRRAAPKPEPEPEIPPGRIDWNDVCPPNSPCNMQPQKLMVQVSGNFDLTDEIMRALGQDPYARAKARFLSATFEFRIRMAMTARQEDMKTALGHLPEYLDALWADARYTPRERRRLLYELWYETDRTPEGARAARTIDEFVRRHLPCGSAEGYSGAELEAFERLHPERRFPVAEGCERPSAP